MGFVVTEMLKDGRLGCGQVTPVSVTSADLREVAVRESRRPPVNISTTQNANAPVSTIIVPEGTSR